MFQNYIPNQVQNKVTQYNWTQDDFQRGQGVGNHEDIERTSKIECLHQDPAHRRGLQWVYTFGPSPIAVPPTCNCSPSIRNNPRSKNHFVCSCLLTINTDRSKIKCSQGCYMWTQPSSCIHHRRESFIQKEKVKVRLLDQRICFDY